VSYHVSWMQHPGAAGRGFSRAVLCHRRLAMCSVFSCVGLLVPIHVLLWAGASDHRQSSNGSMCQAPPGRAFCVQCAVLLPCTCNQG
jgi:hypothetical protein